MTCYAHSRPDLEKSEWQTLDEHSRNVAELAAKFAAPFGCAETARLLGLVHDMGKANPEFQDYLQQSSGIDDEEDGEAAGGRRRGPDHSTLGAQWLDRSVPGLGRLLAYATAGHHAGLADGLSESQGCLNRRLNKRLEFVGEGPCKDPARMRHVLSKEVLEFLNRDSGFSHAFFVRMLYSTLVDADFLDSEAFIDTERSRVRSSAGYLSMNGLLSKLEAFYHDLDLKAKSSCCVSEVVQIRNEVRADCAQAAKLSPGLFTLTVPTGGGKTLSSMLFSLRHAVENGLQRVVVVIPFTSIIEQTADVFRQVFGPENVLEHHCNLDLDNQSDAQRLAVENWDAPIVVTTNVQFFESLFAHRSSRCRKIHNLSRAVIVLDEAQGIPIGVVKPCLMALEELVARYHSTIVLTTATLPVFFDRALLGDAALKGGVNGVTEIVPLSRNLAARLKRVSVERIQEPLTDDELIERLAGEKQVLVVVSTRRHARELYLKAKDCCPDSLVLHLSAQMCGVHRTEVLQRARACLSMGTSCLLVSTQLIEAGVDIDFPCVFREVAGVDSITQAAGRCNREGRLPQLGRVVIFESADHLPPSGFLRTAAQQGRLTLRLPEFAGDLLGSEAVCKYFTLLYADVQKGNTAGLDKYEVIGGLIPQKRSRSSDEMLLFKFRELGETFKMIDSNTCSVIVPYGEEGRDLCEVLREEYCPSKRRELMRRLQRYSVSIFGDEPRGKDGQLIADKVHGVCWILTSPELYYSSEFGMMTEPADLFLGI